MKMNRKILVLSLVSALLIAMVGMLSANPDVTWAIDSNGIMYKQPHEESGTLCISGGSSKIIPAENAAQVDEGISFERVRWVGLLTPSSPSEDKKFTVEVGKYDGSAFTGYGKSDEEILDCDVGTSYDPIIESFTVPKNQYLAIRINNTGSCAFTLDLDYGGCYITYKGHTDYPVPELPTIVLSGVGLIALLGFIRYRRRKNA